MTIDESFEHELREALLEGNIPTLLLVLAQITGRPDWLRQPYAPSRGRGFSDNDTGGLSAELQETIRAAAFDALCEWRTTGIVAMSHPTDDQLRYMLAASLGGDDIPAEYGPMISSEILETTVADPLSVPSGFKAVIIGAGLSGLCAAVALAQAGMPYLIVEKNLELGGTWHENRYPGAAVDTPSHLYSFAFAPHDWRRYFAGQSEILEYLRSIASRHGVNPNIRFGTSAQSAAFNEAAGVWEITVVGPDGQLEHLHASMLITAVGALNQPNVPLIEGLESFAGPIFHTARWPAGLDVRGQRVAIIGNGASAMQVLPAIVDDAASVTVFQRSPQWVAPFEQFQREIPAGARWLLEHVPLYRRWYRVRLGWVFNDRSYASLRVDPEWPHMDRSINAQNDANRESLTRYITKQLHSAPDLIEKVLPTYPPFGKRMLLDNGWFAALTREHVTLETAAVAKVGGHFVETVAGDRHEVDVVVLATGFKAVHFLASMDIRGRDGRILKDEWQDDNARAYLGTVVPGFPNMFCLYGPNLQPGHGGSLIFFIERQIHFILDLLRRAFKEGSDIVECRDEICDEYNREVDATHAHMVWAHPGMDTYYRNERGRVVVNNAFRVVDFWHRTLQADLAHFLRSSHRTKGQT
jgi:4-hydroxyacetophenone monooxygenase